MKLPSLLVALFSTPAFCSPLAERGPSVAAPSVTDPNTHITYKGKSAHAVESFLNLRFGPDISGANRFLPPQTIFVRRQHRRRRLSTGRGLSTAESPRPQFQRL